MIIDFPINGDNASVMSPFASRIFKKQIQPLGNCVTYIGKWNGAIASDNALHFLWEFPRPLSFGGVELNWSLLPIIANHITATNPDISVEISDLQIVVHKLHNNGGVSQSFGILTCDVSSKIVDNVTIGHIAIHADPPSKFVSGISIVDLAPKVTDRDFVVWMQVGVQGFYTLTNKLFFHSRQ